MKFINHLKQTEFENYVNHRESETAIKQTETHNCIKRKNNHIVFICFKIIQDKKNELIKKKIREEISIHCVYL